MPCELENGYAYDKRSCYPSVMCDKTFSFPVKVGEFCLLEKLPEPLKYGIYRIEISRSGDELIDRWFNFNINNYYTHYHIETAKILNLKMELIQDGQANALLYRKNRASGSLYFSGIVNELYKLKSQSPLAKELLSSLWGVLCKKNIIKRNSIKKKIILTDELLVGIQPIDGNGENVNVEYMKKNNYYKYEYARIGVFLTSLNRLKMVKLLYPHTKNIFRAHTDGFVCNEPLNLDIGDGLGQWKLEKNNEPCVIKNSNKVEWLKPKLNIRSLKELKADPDSYVMTQLMNPDTAEYYSPDLKLRHGLKYNCLRCQQELYTGVGYGFGYEYCGNCYSEFEKEKNMDEEYQNKCMIVL
jgi:hypothetical protein